MVSENIFVVSNATSNGCVFFFNLKVCQNNLLAWLVNDCHVFYCRTVEDIAVLLSYRSGVGSFSYTVCLICSIAETKEWS